MYIYIYVYIYIYIHYDIVTAARGPRSSSDIEAEQAEVPAPRASNHESELSPKNPKPLTLKP